MFWIFFHAAKLLLLEALYHTENLGGLTSVSTASRWQIVAWLWVNKLHLLETVFEQGASWSAWICHQSLPWVQKERQWYLQLLCWGPHSAMSMFCSSSRNPLHLSKKKMKFSWLTPSWASLTLGAPSAHAPGQSLGPPLTQHWCPALWTTANKSTSSHENPDCTDSSEVSSCLRCPAAIQDLLQYPNDARLPSFSIPGCN